MRSSRAAQILATASAVAALGAIALQAPSDAARDHRTMSGPGAPHVGAAGGDSRLTAQARAAGLTTVGGGEMGWTHRVAGSSIRRRVSAPTAPSATASPSATATATATATPVSGVHGVDVSGYQGSVSWSKWWKKRKRFAYIKATEGTYYKNPKFSRQYDGSRKVGMIRGSYHFANPKDSAGWRQAKYFVKHGGAWSKDGHTLPGALDIEYNPYRGGTCYGRSHASMVGWISSFTREYKKLTRRDAVIYSTTQWWKKCTGNTSKFSRSSPLWLARYSSSIGPLPKGWHYQTFWQYSSTPIDLDRFNGKRAQLEKLADG